MTDIIQLATGNHSEKASWDKQTDRYIRRNFFVIAMDEKNEDVPATTSTEATSFSTCDCPAEEHEKCPKHDAPRSDRERENSPCDCGLSAVFIDFFLPIFSIVTYLCDVGSDIWLAITYGQAGHWWWFGWTIMFVVVTALMMAYYARKDLRVADFPFNISNRTLREFVWIVVSFSLTGPAFGWVYHPLH